VLEEQDGTDLPGRLGRIGIQVAIGCFFAGYVASGIVAGIEVALTGAAIDSYGAQIAAEFGLWFGIFVLPVLASRAWGTGSLRRDYGLGIDWRRDVPRGLVVGLLGQFVLVPVVVLVFEQFQPDLKVDESAVELAKQSHGLGFVALALLFALVAPVIEEVFFRGLFQRALAVRLPDGVAVAVSGVVFGVVHISGGSLAGTLALIVALSCFGWILGAMAMRTGRLGSSIVAHMAFNTVATVQIFLQSTHGK
jgi:membrane protease YdiL (CAAX protease family)